MRKTDEKKKTYQVLGLDYNSTEGEVKRAFIKLAIENHPDLKNHKCEQETSQSKLKFHQVCKAYKAIMTEEATTSSEWNNDKSDEIFFSLLGELLQNSTRKADLYALLSSQTTNNKSQFQDDSEYRCEEDLGPDDEESELNKLLDILQNRLQNGKSVPAGLTKDKLARLKDDFLKQKEENKRTGQSAPVPPKKSKAPAPAPVAKPKPKSKKQLAAEQRRRELEMASIAQELEQKKQKDEERDEQKRQQESDRQAREEEELRKHEDERKRVLNEQKKKKEKEDREQEQRSAKDRERTERARKQQDDDQKRREDEKRKKQDEKAIKQKALKEAKERDEKEKQEQAKKTTPQTKRQTQYQQYQQNQQKYPREVPPRFLRQQQNQQKPMGGSSTQKDEDSNYISNSTDNRVENRADNRVSVSNSDDWEIDKPPAVSSASNVDSSWGGAYNDWGVESAAVAAVGARSSASAIASSKPSTNLSAHKSNAVTGSVPLVTTPLNVPLVTASVALPDNLSAPSNWTPPSNSPIGSERKNAAKTAAAKSLFGGCPVDPQVTNEFGATAELEPHEPAPLKVSDATAAVKDESDMSWGASLTGSSWDNGTLHAAAGGAAVDVVGQPTDAGAWAAISSQPCEPAPSEVKKDSPSSMSWSTKVVDAQPTIVDTTPSPPLQASPELPTVVTSTVAASAKLPAPGLTSWAGLDDFDGFDTAPVSYGIGAKPKSSNADSSLDHSVESLEKPKQRGTARHVTMVTTEEAGPACDGPAAAPKTPSGSTPVTPLDQKVDSHSKVSGWLQSAGGYAASAADSTDAAAVTDGGGGWVEEGEEKAVAGGSEEYGWTTVANIKTKPGSVPGTPSKTDANAWTHRSLKQLLDMGFKREHAEKALRDNSGIIESAVNDLVLIADSQVDSADISHASSAADIGNATEETTKTNPQKLNRKQRRKLQQLQQSGQPPQLPPPAQLTPPAAPSVPVQPPVVSEPSVNTSVPQPTTILPTKNAKNPGGDGILPTPPMNYRLHGGSDATSRGVGLDSSQQQSIIGTSTASTGFGNLPPPTNASTFPNRAPGQPTSQPPIRRPSPPGAVGSERSSAAGGAILPSPVVVPQLMSPIAPPSSMSQPPLPIPLPHQMANEFGMDAAKPPPPQLPIGAPSASSAPPQPIPLPISSMSMQSQQLRDSPSTSRDLPSSSGSQEITNSMIQQYLQQIAQQSSDIKTVAASGGGGGPMMSVDETGGRKEAVSSLSALLHQAVPSSGSAPSRMSKLAQWTQSSNEPPAESAGQTDHDDSGAGSERSNNSTPPSSGAAAGRTVDPVSAKWGVIAAPRLSPTPAEFKPGVRWKSREPVDDDDDEATVSDTKMTEEEKPAAYSTMPSDERPPLLPPQICQPPQTSAMSSHVHQQAHPLMGGQMTSVATVMDVSSMMPVGPVTVRPPPGLSSMNAFQGVKTSRQHGLPPCWIHVKGVSSAVDPGSLRQLCQQYGTLLHFRPLTSSSVCARYETSAHAQQAKYALDGNKLFNQQVSVDLLDDDSPVLAAAATDLPPPPVAQQPPQQQNDVIVTLVGGTNHVTSMPPMQHPPPPPHMQPFSFGALWGAPPPPSVGGAHPAAFIAPTAASFHAPSPPPNLPAATIQQPFNQPPSSIQQQSFVPPPAMNGGGMPLPGNAMPLNGAFNPWMTPHGATMIPAAAANNSHMWASTATQPPPPVANLFPPFAGGWLPQSGKQEMMPAVMNGGLDRCLPTALLNGQEPVS